MKNIKHKSKALLFMFSSMFWECSNAPENKLEGHWVSEGYYTNQKFFTVDFHTENENPFGMTDSVIYYIDINKNSWHPTVSSNLVKGDSDGDFEFLSREYEMGKLSFKNGDLFIDSEDYKGKLLRVDGKKSLYRELFCGEELAVELPSAFNVQCEQIPELFVESLIIGFPTESVNHDSAYIVGFDRYMNLDEIPEFVKDEKSMLAEEDRNNLTIALVADKKVHPSNILDIVRKIKLDSTIKVVKVFYDYQDQKICNVKI